MPNGTEPVRGAISDISTQGVYFTTDQPLRPETRISITFAIPGEISSGTQVSLNAIARVVRTQNGPAWESQRVGVAVEIESFCNIRNKSVPF